ncbi:MAG: hypothetical protein GF418_10010 [Chitinivibrionales bacterium]|nr:hypothetical protein [Chitinivibrionales bacterium]MBD3395946.1 hypothetical protein [Chitinivibrionales bacterium]
MKTGITMQATTTSPARHRRMRGPILAGATAFFMSCTFSPDSFEPLTMSAVDGPWDTLSTFPTLRFAFSEPLEDESISLSLVPEGAAYHAELNTNGDTAMLIVTGMLQGRTQYTVGLDRPVHTPGGAVLGPDDVSFSFFTHAREQEPNDTKDTTIRFVDPVCGSIDPVNDTDIYCLTDTPVAGLYLRSHDAGVALGLTLADTTGRDTSLVTSDPEKYLPVPGSLTAPVYIEVFSLSGGSGRYELQSYAP